MTESARKPATIEEIKVVVEQLKASDGDISRYIDLRHMLTENTNRNLYEGNSIEEGREALRIRNALDATIFSTNDNDLASGNPQALHALKRGISIENIAEQFGFLEHIVKAGNGDAKRIKQEITYLADNADKFDRFSSLYQNMILDAKGTSPIEKFLSSIGIPLLENLTTRGKIDFILRALEEEVKLLNERH